jgi:hypothetical protein
MKFESLTGRDAPNLDAELRFPSWLRLPLAQEGILICFSPLFKGKVRDASASAQIEHKGGKWVFSELKNEPVRSHFYCITSCLLAHCPFGRFFLAFFPLYSGGSDATLAHPR